MDGRPFNFSHYLMGVRFDNWLRLLGRCGFRIDPKKLPQAALITLTSLVLFPFALLESAVCAIPVTRTKIEKDPVFILGCWRSGTTYLQNLMSRDPQFAWAEPVGTSMFSNSVLLGWLLKGGVAEGLKGARPMDNVQYSLSLPMEETFAVASVTPWAIDHMIAFPWAYKKYLSSAFVADMPEKQRREWRRAYAYMAKKMTWMQGGKQLLFKSPDNTCRIRELLTMYPDAKLVNIYRNPYETVRSTIHMFKSQMELLRLTPLPKLDDFEDELENVILDVFERMYRELFALEPLLKPKQLVNVKYEAFVKRPVLSLHAVYDALGLDGFETAKPHFEAFAESQRDYRKNDLETSPRLRRKINDRLGFYFERYGYTMKEDE